MSAGKPFYGWFLVAITCVCYGLGLAPGYFSWGLFSKEIIADLGIDRGELGGVFGLFTFMYSSMGLAAGILQQYFRIRWVMTVGFLISSGGFLLLSRADSALDCYLAFGILAGGGIGLATIIPCQTLAQNWFFKWRAVTMALILAAGGVSQSLVPQMDKYILAHADWRVGWLVIAGLSAFCAVLASILIRDTPEQLGQFRDGAAEDPIKAMSGAAGASVVSEWGPWQAIRTRQFILVVFCGFAYAVPWGVIAAHGRLHLDSLGHTATVVAALMSALGIFSIGGRLSGAAGDFVRPKTVLAASLLIETLGVAGLLVARADLFAYGCIGLIGLGFGAAYVSIPVVFTDFFGRRAFGATSGLRMFLTGILNGLGPWIAGEIHDQTGSYTLAFYGLAVLGLTGFIAALVCTHPGAPPAET